MADVAERRGSGRARTVQVDDVADHVQRRQALDPLRSFIVQAPAGSGKTELLIQRYLTLLAQVDRPESIIAITFTRKAAAEMRHRVIDALQSAQRTGPEVGPSGSGEPGASTEDPEQGLRTAGRTQTLAAAVLGQNRERDWNLIDHPQRLRIETIDALCAGLVRRMPWMSRMGAPPRPSEDAGHLYRRAAVDTLALLDSGDEWNFGEMAVARLLSHLDNHSGRAASLLASMLARRDQWLRHVIGGRGGSGFRSALEARLADIVCRELDQVRAVFPPDLVEATVRLSRYAAENLDEAGLPSPITACSDLHLLPPASIDGMAAWLGLAELFLTRDGQRRKALDRRQGFPPTEAGRALRRECLDIPLGDTAIDALARLRQLPPVAMGDRRWALVESLMELLPVAVAQLRLVFEDEGEVDFTEIALAARYALGTDELPTDLAFAMDCRIRHLLVDEFQDTSQSQFDFLSALTAGWTGEDGRTLFLVGDPMQSIYGFREAEVGLFLQARQSGLGQVRLEPLRLSVNFRSTPGIVDWINHVVGRAFPPVEDVFTGAVTYEPAVAHTPDRVGTGPAIDSADPPPPVQIHPLLVDDMEREAARVIDILDQEQRVDPQVRIGVLVRSRSHLVRIVAALRAAGRPFRAVEIDALAERPVVGDLVALTRALIDPADRVAWLSILRARWCGLSLADLYVLAGDHRSATLAERIANPAVVDGLSDDGRQRLERVMRVLDDAIPRRGSMAFRRWLEGTWIRLGGPAGLENATDGEDAAAYFDLVEEMARGAGLEDPDRFADAVRRLFARPDVEADDRLQLLTIHKSKGLEFDTVILPGLGRRTETDRASLLSWLEYVDDTGRSQLLVAPIPETGGEADTLYGYVRRIQRTQSQNEDTRLLYVAVTRARRGLHLIGHTRLDPRGGPVAPGAGSLLGKIWSGVGEAFVVEAGSGSPGALSVPGDARPRTLKRLAIDWAPPDLESFRRVSRPVDDIPAAGPAAPSFEWAGHTQRRVGIVVHALLQRLGPGDRVRDLEGTIEAALSVEGLAGDALTEAAQRVERALEQTLADPRGLWILDTHEEDRREYALTGTVDGRIRRVVIDRTFVDGPDRWIIDYKTGIHRGGGLEAFLDNERNRYRAQLDAYAQVVGQMDSRPIRLGLYFPLMGGWREWAWAPASDRVFRSHLPARTEQLPT